MGLSLRSLRDAAAAGQHDGRMTSLLRAELHRIFGPTLKYDRPLGRVLDEANSILSTERYRDDPPVCRTSLACQFAQSDNAGIRLFAAHVIPEHLVSKLAFDKDPAVRHAVAWRVGVRTLDEMTSRYPHDDQLGDIASQRGLLSESKVDARGRYQKMGDAAKQWEGPELSDQWYDTQAKLLLKKYANNLEYCWEEIAVRQFANAYRSSTGLVIDEKRLYDTVKDMIEERESERLEKLDDDPLAENPIKESIDWLRLGGNRMDQAFMPVLDEDYNDPVQKLLDEQLSSLEYTKRFNALYSVRETAMPVSMGKYRIGEARSVTRVPVTCHTVAGRSVQVVDERALDKYCRCWNEVQLRSGTSEPLQISWSHSPQSDGAVNFSAILR